MATVLAAQLYRQIGQPLPEGLSSAADAAREALAADPAPLVQSLLRMDGKGAAAADVQALLARASAASPTIDRAVALIWLDKALGGGLSRGLAAQAQAVPRPPQGGWRAGRGALGLPEWRWTGAQPPATLSLGAPQRAEAASRSTDINAVVSYRSRMAEAASLPIGIERRLYRLVPVAGTKDDKEAGGSVPGTAGLDFVARPVKAGDKLDSNTLYVDEIVLTPRQGAYRYGLLEVPLPPGGEVEGTTWGLRIDGLPDPENKASGLQAFQRATTYEMGMLSYHQPVIALEHPAVLRQLVRFSLPGRFRLPPARFFRMYQPEAKAPRRRQDRGLPADGGVRRRWVCLPPSARCGAQAASCWCWRQSWCRRWHPAAPARRRQPPRNLAGLTRCASPGWPTARPGSTGSVPARRWRRPCRRACARRWAVCGSSSSTAIWWAPMPPARTTPAAEGSGRGVLLRGRPADRPGARAQSCGRYFEPRRLGLSSADWRRFWQAAGAPAWLQDMQAVRAERTVPVAELLAALQAVPPAAQQAASATLVSVLTVGRGEGTLASYGSLLRAKAWTMPDPARPGASIGGAAGWLADGSPAWLGGQGAARTCCAAPHRCCAPCSPPCRCRTMAPACWSTCSSAIRCGR